MDPARRASNRQLESLEAFRKSRLLPLAPDRSRILAVELADDLQLAQP
jgi:hypothetical protein